MASLISRVERLERSRNGHNGPREYDYPALAFSAARDVLMQNLGIYPPFSNDKQSRDYEDTQWQETLLTWAWQVGATYLECFAELMADDDAHNELVEHANALDESGEVDLSMRRLPATALSAWNPPGSFERWRYTTLDERLTFARTNPDKLEPWIPGWMAVDSAHKLIAQHGEPLFLSAPHECFDREL